MVRVVAVRLVVLVYALLCVAGQQSPCHDDAPDSCEFTGKRSCGWILGGDVKFRMDGNDSSVAVGGQEKAAGNLTSRVACPTGGREHCLEFRYFFERNNILEINVYIQEIGGESHLAWNETGSDSVSWEQANVSVKTAYNFTIVFEMKKVSLTAIAQSAQINSIYYTQSSCSPSSTTAEPRPSTTLGDISPPDTPSNTGVIVGIVVGVLLVVAVAVLILILCRKKQFHFGNFRITKRNEREAALASTSPSATHSSGNNDTNHVTHSNRVHCYSTYANHELDNPTTQPNDTNLQAQNCQDAESSTRDVSGPKYTVVNKSEKGRQPEVSAVSMSANNNPYEIIEIDASVMHCTSMHQPKKIEHTEPYLGDDNSDEKNIRDTDTRAAGTHISEVDEYNRLNRDGGQKKSNDDIEQSLSALPSFDAEYIHLKTPTDCVTVTVDEALIEQNPRNPDTLDDSTTERSLPLRDIEAQNGEYNLLEFDRKSHNSVACSAAKVAPSGGEYNHLTLGTARDARADGVQHFPSDKD